MRTMQGIRGFFGAAGWEGFLTPRTAFGMTKCSCVAGEGGGEESHVSLGRQAGRDSSLRGLRSE
jgi:hypothetical protein